MLFIFTATYSVELGHTMRAIVSVIKRFNLLNNQISYNFNGLVRFWSVDAVYVSYQLSCAMHMVALIPQLPYVKFIVYSNAFTPDNNLSTFLEINYLLSIAER